MTISTPFKLGNFTVDPPANQLLDDGKARRVDPVQMAVLSRLAATPGDLVTRAQLLESVGERRLGGEPGLTAAVSALRLLLGDSEASPRHIETVGTQGYRLVAPVSAAAGHPPAGGPRRDGWEDEDDWSQAPLSADAAKKLPAVQTRSPVNTIIWGAVGVALLVALIAAWRFYN